MEYAFVFFCNDFFLASFVSFVCQVCVNFFVYEEVILKVDVFRA